MVKSRIMELKYWNFAIYIYIYIHTHTHTYKMLACMLSSPFYSTADS